MVFAGTCVFLQIGGLWAADEAGAGAVIRPCGLRELGFLGSCGRPCCFPADVRAADAAQRTVHSAVPAGGCPGQGAGPADTETRWQSRKSSWWPGELGCICGPGLTCAELDVGKQGEDRASEFKKPYSLGLGPCVSAVCTLVPEPVLP